MYWTVLQYKHHLHHEMAINKNWLLITISPFIAPSPHSLSFIPLSVSSEIIWALAPLLNPLSIHDLVDSTFHMQAPRHFWLLLSVFNSAHS